MYQPKSITELNSSKARELVYSSQVFKQNETWFRVLPTNPTFATAGFIFPAFVYFHDSKRRLLSYATWQKDCIIKAFLLNALSTGDAGIRKIVETFIPETRFRELKDSTPESGSNRELIINMLMLVKMPQMNPNDPLNFAVPPDYNGVSNPFPCSIKQVTLQSALLNLVCNRKGLNLLKPKEGNAICVIKTGTGLAIKYNLELSDEPVPLDSFFFEPRSVDNPRGYPDSIGILLQQTQSPECIFNYLMNAFFGEEHPIDKSLESQVFDPLAPEADDMIDEIKAKIKPSLFNNVLSVHIPSSFGSVSNRIDLD